MGSSDSEVPSSPLPATQDERRQIAQALATTGVRVRVTAGKIGALDGLLGLLSLLGQPSPGTASTNSSEPKPTQRQRKRGGNKRANRAPIQKCCRKLSFTDLPREIRDRIYFWILRPDCGLSGLFCNKNHEHLHNGIGTTKILCLNRQIHREAIGLILAIENILVLPSTSGPMFRSMFAFGKPLFFHMETRTSQCRVPQQFCELNLVGLRYLAIKVRYPLPRKGEFMHPLADRVQPVARSHNYVKRIQALIQSVRQAEAMLWKCTSLQTLRLVLQTEGRSCWPISDPYNERWEYVAVTEDDHPEMRDLLSTFLNVAKCKKFQTAAEEDKSFFVYQSRSDGGEHGEWITIHSYQDPLVRQYNHRAGELSIRAHFDRTWHASHVKFEHEADVPKLYRIACVGPTDEQGAIFEDEVKNMVHNEALVDHEGDLSSHQEDTDCGQEDGGDENYTVEPAPMPPSPRLISFPALEDIPGELPPLPSGNTKAVVTAKRRLQIYANVDAAQPYQLRPECRKCYELFASFEGLEHHLQQFPRHRTPFKRKQYNVLNYWAQHGGRRKCWTCAKSYASLEFLAKHLDECGHRREGMIPRWKQENGWTNRRDGKRNARERAAREREWRKAYHVGEQPGEQPDQEQQNEEVDEEQREGAVLGQPGDEIA